MDGMKKIFFFCFNKIVLLNASISNEIFDTLNIILTKYKNEFDFNMKKDANKFSPIHILCSKNRESLTLGEKVFLSLKTIDINEHEEIYLNTPLHLAVLTINTEIVRILLKNPKIDVNSKNKAGYTPLHVAFEHLFMENNFQKRFEILKILLEDANIDIMAKNNDVFLDNFYFTNIIERNPFANGHIINHY